MAMLKYGRGKIVQTVVGPDGSEAVNEFDIEQPVDKIHIGIDQPKQGDEDEQGKKEQ